MLYSLRSNLVSRKLITEQFYFPNIMLRTNLLAFGVGGAGFENFENPATAATGLSCIPHRISSQCTRARESRLISVQSALNTKPSLEKLVQTTPVSPRKCAPSPKRNSEGTRQTRGSAVNFRNEIINSTTERFLNRNNLP